MNKLISILVCLAMAFMAMPVLAEETPENPFGGLLPDEYADDSAPRGDRESGESIALEIKGQRVDLAFDASPQYSNVQDGMVQASYYAYGPDGDTLYELFVSFPDTARAGMILTPEYASMTNEECSVVLIVSRQSKEVYYFSSLMDGVVYPEGSDFAISIESIADAEGGVNYAGTLSATLVALDMASGGVDDTLLIPETTFSFTISGSRPRGDVPSAPELPDVPGDLRKV